MKLLALVLVAVLVCVLALPLLLVATIATHPWLAIGSHVGTVQVVMPEPAPTPAAPGQPGAPPVAIGPVPVAVDGGIVEAARTWLGVPYVFAGCSRSGVDCSCLTQLVYRAVGLSLPRVASDQFNATVRVAREDLQPGDLVFFANTYMPGISHVGIYIGGGQQINAPTEGEVVSIAPVFTGYWGAHYAGAGRVRN